MPNSDNFPAAFVLISSSIFNRPYSIGGRTPMVPRPVGTFFRFSSRSGLRFLSMRTISIRSCFASKNVFQPRLRASLIAQPDEIGLGVVDSPAGKCIDMNISLVPSGDGNGRAIPFEKSLIDPVDFLNDGKLKMQSRVPDWFSNRFAELRNDYLLRLVNREETSLQRAQ